LEPVGKGVLDPDGGSPRDRWRMYLELIRRDSERVGRAAATLLVGGPIMADDAAVQLTCTVVGPDRVHLVFRDADVSTKFSLHIEAKVILRHLADRHTRRRLDPARDAQPLPDVWITPISSTRFTVELFNCEVFGVTIRQR
jgi:hypothetical protein